MMLTVIGSVIFLTLFLLRLRSVRHGSETADKAPEPISTVDQIEILGREIYGQTLLELVQEAERKAEMDYFCSSRCKLAKGHWEPCDLSAIKHSKAATYLVKTEENAMFCYVCERLELKTVVDGQVVCLNCHFLSTGGFYE